MLYSSMLVNSDNSDMYYSILPELRCIGLPDLIDHSYGRPVVVEKKFEGTTPDLIWLDHELQLAIYMVSVERLGIKPCPRNPQIP
jgi:hypothetical protein